MEQPPIASHPGSATEWLNRAADLLEKHFPSWSVLRSDKPPSTGNVFWVLIPEEPDEEGSVQFEAFCPYRRLGRRTAGLGRPDPGYPRGLYPLLLSMVVAFRLREFGWHPGVQWPNQIVVEQQTIGIVHWQWRKEGLFASVKLAIEGKPPSLSAAPFNGAFPVEPVATLPSLIQVFAQGMEAPWPRELLLHHYRRWVTNLNEDQQIDDEGNLVAPGHDPMPPDQLPEPLDESTSR